VATRRIGELLRIAAVTLRAAGSTSPRLDAELLLAFAAGWRREVVLAHPEREASAAVESAFRGLLERRAQLEPMAYLVGEREFYGRAFRVDRRALIPRPETELLVDLGISSVDAWRGRGVEPRVVEIGTGSGAIAVSLALERQVRVLATDISGEALEVAMENACRLGASELLTFVEADLLDGDGVAGPLHVVLANLPYVPSARDLPRDVRDYEPRVALFGGERGTELIERLLRQARPLMERGGEVCVELDEEEQAQPVADLARTLYRDVEVRRDAGGYDRVVRAVV
jgi:release factor glutamine methyltransferase